MTYLEFEDSYVFILLCQVDTKLWVQSGRMTEKEKVKFPSHSTCGGYLKDIPYKEAFQSKWWNWSKENRQVFMDLENFDADIFEHITGVKVKVEKESEPTVKSGTIVKVTIDGKDFEAVIK